MPMCKGKEQSNSILYPQPADRDLLYTVYWVLVVTRCAVSMCRGRNAAAGIVVCRSVAAMAML